MPTLSMFYGIIIKMYNEKGVKHHIPHFHAEYQGQKAVITFDGEVLEGNLPSPKLKLIFAWVVIHREELEANWTLLNEGNPYFKIEPLR